MKKVQMNFDEDAFNLIMRLSEETQAKNPENVIAAALKTYAFFHEQATNNRQIQIVDRNGFTEIIKEVRFK